MKKEWLYAELKKETLISGYPKEYEKVVMRITEIAQKRITLELSVFYETFDVYYDDEPQIKQWKEIWKGNISQVGEKEEIITVIIDSIWIEGYFKENKEYGNTAIHNYEDKISINSPIHTFELILKVQEEIFTVKRMQRPDYKPSEEILEKERKKAGWDMSWHKSGIDPSEYPYPEE